jgi:DNA-binding SARP family transcriptional activator
VEKPIKIRTFGMFRVAVADRDFPRTGVGQQKPLQLLQVLLALNPDGTSVPALADLLWPDADADAAHHAFEVNLQRLRRQFGRSEVLLLQAANLRLNRALCWLDCWELDALGRQLDGDAGAVSREVLARRLLTVYRGHFLPGVEVSWALIARQRFDARFIRAVEQLGDLLEAEGAVDLAIECYGRALAVDPVAEVLCRRAMSALVTAGRGTEALALYERCADACQARLGLPPSALTRQLADALRAALE